MKFTHRQFQVIYRQDQDGLYVASVPALPGCHTQGKTIEQAEDRVKEAIEAYLESLVADKQRLPRAMDKYFLGSVTI